MAKTIDQRVVSMEFDNKNFEKNVSTSMSTLDKLKEKLNFRGASKAMDELNGSLKNVNTSVLEKALDGVGTKFNALEQIAIGSLRKIGEQAVDTAEKLIKSLSTDNIAEGWTKFENKTTAVATLRAQGFAIEEINEQLDKLNWFTDETSYNFTAMVGEIGKFTAAGQGLEESVTAMMGIANWAALSGQNAATASRAMYQLSQAMGKGALRYDDYKSIQNANMDSVEFRRMAAQAAIDLGMLQKEAEDVYRYVKETEAGLPEVADSVVTLKELFTSDELTKAKWLDSDVMMLVFKRYGQAVQTLQTIVDEAALGEDIETASGAMIELKNQAKELADQMIAAGEATEDNAMNLALKKVSLDAVRDLESVKEEVEEYNQSLIDAGKDAVDTDTALEALGYGIDEFALKALEAAQNARTWTDVIDSVKDAVSTGWMNTFETIFGNADEATELMTRFANDFWEIFASGGEGRTDAFKFWREYIDPVSRETIAAAQNLREEARQVAIDAQTALANGGKGIIDGRALLFSTEEGNLGAVIQLLQNFKDILSAVKNAWNEIFYGTTDEDEIAQQKADILISISKALKAFADALKITEEKADKIKRTFKGLFAILDIIGTFIKTVFAGAWKIISSLFGQASGSIWDLTASMGDGLVAFRDWIKSSDIFGKAIDGIVTAVTTLIGWIKDGFKAISELPFVKTIVDSISRSISTAGGYISDFFSRLHSGEKAGDILSDIGKKIADTSVVAKFLISVFNGIKDFFSGTFSGVGDFFGTLWNSTTDFFSNIGTSISNFFTGVGQGTTEVKDGLQSTADGVSASGDQMSQVFDVIKQGLDAFVGFVKQALGEISLPKIIGIISGFAILTFVYKLTKLFKDTAESVLKFSKTIQTAVKQLSGAISTTVKKVGGAISTNIKAKALVALAGAILMLVGAIVAMYFLDPVRLATAAGILVIIVGMLAILTDKVGKTKGNIKDLAKFGVILIGFVSSIMLLIAALRLLNDVNFNNAGPALILVTVVAATIAMFALVMGGLMKKFKISVVSDDLKNLAILLLELSGSMLIVSLAAKLLSTSDASSLEKAALVLGTMAVGLAILFGAIGGIQVLLNKVNKNKSGLWTKNNNPFKGVASVILSLAGGLLMITVAIGILGKFKDETFQNGFTRVGLISALVAAIVAVSYFAGEHASKAGRMLLMFSGSILILIGVIKLISLLSIEEIIGGMAVILAFELLASLLIRVSKYAGENASKAGLMLIEFAGSMALLTAVIWALSWLSTEDLVKAAGVIIAIGAMFALLIGITKLAENISERLKGTLITITIALIALAGSIAALAIIGNENDIIKAALAMAIVMGMFALIIGMLKLTKDMGKVMGVLVVITTAIGIIGFLLFAMGAWGGPATDALINAAAISLLLVVFTGIVVLLSKTLDVVDGFDLAMALVAIAGLGLIAWGISSFISQMGKDNIDGENALKNALAIAAVMTVMGIIVVAVSTIMGAIMSTGVGAPGVVVSLIAGVLGMLGMVLVMAAMVGVLKDMGDLSKPLDTAHALGDLILAISGAMILLGIAGVLAAPAVLSIAVMGYAIDQLKNIVKSLGEEEPQIRAFIDKGIPLLEELGLALGTFFGNIVGGFVSAVAEGVFDIFPILGTKLSDFATNVKPFMEYMDTGVDEKLITKTTNLAKALLTLTAAELVSSLTNFISTPIFGASGDTTKFTENLVGLATGIKTFASEIGDTTFAANVYEAIALLQKFNMVKPDPNADFAYFSDNLKPIGEGIAGFSEAVNGKMYPAPMEQAVNILKKLAELDKDLTNHGGIAAAIIGDQSLESFGNTLKALGEGVSNFSGAVNGKVNDKGCDPAFAVLEDLIRIDKSLENHGGLWAALAGDSDLKDFGTCIQDLGVGIAAFSQSVDGKVNPLSCGKAASAIKDLVEKTEKIEGGFAVFSNFISDVTNATNLDKFIINMRDIGEAVANFSAAVEGSVSSNTNLAIGVLGELVKIEGIQALINQMNGNGSVDNFKSNMEALANGIVSFGNIVKETDLASAKEAVNILGLLSLIDQNVNAAYGGGFYFITAIGNATSIEHFVQNIASLGRGLNGFVVELNSNGVNFGAVAYSIETAVNALGKLSEIQNSVTGGGAWGFITSIGNASGLNLFASNMTILARGLMNFATELVSGGSINREGINTAVTAIEGLSRLNTVISNLGSVDKLNGYIAKLQIYTDSLGMLKDIMDQVYAKVETYDVKKLDVYGETLNKLSTLTTGTNSFTANDIYKNMGVGSIPTSALSNIKLDGSGTNIIEQWMSQATGGVTADGIANMFSSSGFDNVLTGGFGNFLGGLDFSNVAGSFVSGLGVSFENILPDDIQNLMGDGLNNFLNNGLGGAIGNFDFNDIAKNFGINLGDTLGKLDWSALTGENGEGILDGSIGNLVSAFTGGLNSDESKEELEKAGSDMVGNVLDGARQKVADFAQVGKNSVNGFINAMTAMFPQVKETGTELAKNLESGLTMTLKIQSPSKVMYGLGEFVGQGLINGIKDTEADVGNEGEALGNAVNDRLQTALNNVSDYLDLNIDTNPTITPVLDLSNVNTGVEQLDSMFDTTRSVNLAGSVNAAMGTANMNVQNEIKVDNSDIVKSLAELRSDMSIMGDKISKLQVRMDTGALVGELVSPMDKALGERSIRRGRL